MYFGQHKMLKFRGYIDMNVKFWRCNYPKIKKKQKKVSHWSCNNLSLTIYQCKKKGF